jgi:hypothetical protein
MLRSMAVVVVVALCVVMATVDLMAVVVTAMATVTMAAAKSHVKSGTRHATVPCGARSTLMPTIMARRRW